MQQTVKSLCRLKKNATKTADCSYIDYPQNKKAVPPDWMLVKYTFVKIYRPRRGQRGGGTAHFKDRKKSFLIPFDF